MGFKKTLPLFFPFNAGTFQNPVGVSITGSNTYTGPITNVTNLDNIGAQVIWTGNPQGTLTVNGSNDGVNFFALTFNPALAQPAGSALSYGINLNQFPWPYLEFQYVNTSGSGTLLLSITGKDLN